MANKYSGSPSKSKSLIVNQMPRATRVVEPVAEENMAARLVSFQVTTDSVVATARLVFDESHSHVSLYWGDDTIEEINLSKLRDFSKVPDAAQDPNALEIQHVYRSPLDSGRKIVMAKTKSVDGKVSWDTQVVELDRRYLFKFYPMTIYFPEHLDSSFETHSEVEVRMFVDDANDQNLKAETWVEDILTNPDIGNPDQTVNWRLDGSEFTREISYSDVPISVSLHIEEHDGFGKHGSVGNILWDSFTRIFQLAWWVAENITVEFDGTTNDFSLPLEIHPRDLDDPRNVLNGKSRTWFKIWGEGKMMVLFEMEMKLIVPVNQDLQQVMTSS